MKIMNKETQQFIRLLKRMNTVEEALKIMTYGYTDPDTGEYEVASYPIVANFFADFINCCDSPEGIFRQLLHEMDVLEFRERIKEDKPSTWQEKMTRAMVNVLQMCRVRNEEGYCNGFSDCINKEDLDTIKRDVGFFGPKQDLSQARPDEIKDRENLGNN